MARDVERCQRERSVRVFTVNNESRYVLVRNIPALGVIDDLLKRLSLYGKVCEYRILDHADDLPDDDDDDGHDEDAERRRDDNDRFTDTVWIQYEAVNNARHAKVRAVQKPFFGSMLHIAYAPQFESREDTMLKLTQRRELLQRRARMLVAAQHHYDDRPRAQQYHQPIAEKPASMWTQKPAAARINDEFIGPQLPARGWRPPVEPKKTVAPPQDTKPKRRRI